jgi:hypothetical protein
VGIDHCVKRLFYDNRDLAFVLRQCFLCHHAHLRFDLRRKVL